MPSIEIFQKVDPFYVYYKHKQKDNDSVILQKIQKNLAILKNLKRDTQLKFNENGEIAITQQQEISPEQRDRNLVIFATFVKNYFKTHALSHAEANDFIHDIEALENSMGYSSFKELEKAKEQILINEKLPEINQMDDAKAKGKACLNDSISKLQKIVQEDIQNKKNGELAHKIVVGAFITGFASAVPLILGVVFFIPLVVAGVILAGSALITYLLAGLVEDHFDRNIDENLEKLNLNNPLPKPLSRQHLVEQLRFLDHFKDPNFDKFLKEFENANDLLTDPDKHLNLHRLYEIESKIKALKQDKTIVDKKTHLVQISYELRKSLGVLTTQNLETYYELKMS